MIPNLLRIKDIKPYLASELNGLFYDENEIGSLARIIVKTIFPGAGLHQIYNSTGLLTPEQVLMVRDFVKELRTGKPYQYITGETDFCGCKIKVRPGVLIPRPETEELAGIIIRENREFQGNIADFGTGSGCIAISLAAAIHGSSVTGYDISDEALEIAAENASINNTDVKFLKLDILDAGIDQLSPAGIVVSNPPYVLNSEKASMRKNVLDFEPHASLFVDDLDPLLFYGKLAGISLQILTDGGLLYFEINERMGSEVSKLLSDSGFSEIRLIKDLHNKDRFIKAKRS